MQNAKEINQLKVMKGDSEVGTLCRVQSGYELVFNPNWQNKMITYRIKGSSVPMSQLGESLPPFFANLLPEGYRLKALREKVKTSEDDLFSLLAASGGTFIGDVYIQTGASNVLKEISSPKKINFYDFFIKQAGEEMPETISGAQEKISSSMISFPINIAEKNKQYILKLNPKDKPHLVENEFACMTLAKKCKLNVAEVKLVADKDENKALLVERFDRIWNEENKSFEMVHQEDGCQFLNLYPSQKYRVSWNQIAESVMELTDSNAIEILNLLKLYVFSYLIGNGDLHAKNVSLYDLPGCPRTITPVYDLICTRIFGDEYMGLKLDGKDTNIERKMFIDFGVRYGVPAPAITMMLDKLLELFEKNKAILFSFPMTTKQEKLLSEMVQSRMNDLSPKKD